MKLTRITHRGEVVYPPLRGFAKDAEIKGRRASITALHSENAAHALSLFPNASASPKNETKQTPHNGEANQIIDSIGFDSHVLGRKEIDFCHGKPLPLKHEFSKDVPLGYGRIH